MKAILLVFLAFVFFSCKKEQLRDDIAGTWEYEKYFGEAQLPPLPPGNGKIIVLYESGRFERWQHDTLVFKGEYKLKKKKDCYPGGGDFAMRTNETNSSDLFVSLVEGKLMLGTSNCYTDPSTTVYRRLK